MQDGDRPPRKNYGPAEAGRHTSTAKAGHHEYRCGDSVMAAIVAAFTLSAGAQSRIEPDKNSYSPEQDVELGRQAAAEVRKELPLVNDRTTGQFVEGVGERLVAEIPDYLQQPAFRYTFDVVNLKEINAFALPGGPMFLHRGMIEAAHTDAELPASWRTS